MILNTRATRREFIKACIRFFVIGCLAMIGVFLSIRRFLATGASSQNCSIEAPCSGCAKLKNCRDPKAVDYQQKSTNSQTQKMSLE